MQRTLLHLSKDVRRAKLVAPSAILSLLRQLKARRLRLYLLLLLLLGHGSHLRRQHTASEARDVRNAYAGMEARWLRLHLHSHASKARLHGLLLHSAKASLHWLLLHAHLTVASLHRHLLTPSEPSLLRLHTPHSSPSRLLRLYARSATRGDKYARSLRTDERLKQALVGRNGRKGASLRTHKRVDRRTLRATKAKWRSTGSLAEGRARRRTHGR